MFTTTLECILATTSIALFVLLVGFFLAFICKKRQYRELEYSASPYEIWNQLENGSYTIPITTSLYKADESGFTCIGNVADNFSSFSKKSLADCLNDAYYGTFFDRSYISVKIIQASSSEDLVKVKTSLGKTFFIKRSENKEFPKAVNIAFRSSEKS